MRRYIALALTILVCSSCSAFAPAAGLAGVASVPSASVGGRLLYVRNGSVEELSSAGTKEIAKADPNKGSYAMPAWSPDGGQIAYMIRQKNFSDIGLMSADGAGQTLLTRDENSVIDNNLWAAMPAWSPDGKHILYSSDQGKSGANIDLRIWLMTLATRRAATVTTPDFQAGGDADASFRPGHPDQLVYTRWSYETNGTAAYSTLVLYNLTTQERFALTPTKDTDFQPAWSPDGKTLAFIRRGQASDELYAAAVPVNITADLTLPATLLESGVNAQPCWSPDGSELAYISENNNQFDLYQVGVSTAPTISAHGKPTQLTNDGIDATSRPSWTR